MNWAAVFMLAAMIAGCSPVSSNGAFEVRDAKKGDIRDIVPANGEIHKVVELAAPVPSEGKVERIYVQPGDHVTRGQRLALLTPREVSADAYEAGSDIDQSRIARLVAENRYAKQVASFTALSMLRDRGFVTTPRVESANHDLEIERLGFVAAQKKLESSMQKLSLLKSKTSSHNIISSPCDCVVEGVNIVVGQTVSPTLIDAFFLSGGGDAMSINADVPEQDIARVQAAGEVRFTVQALPDESFPAILERIDDRPIKQGRFVYYPVKLGFTRTNKTIKSGMTADVEFVNADSHNVLVISKKALYYQPRGYVPMMPAYVKAIYDKAKSYDDKRLALAMADGSEFGILMRSGRRKIFVAQAGRPVRKLVRIGQESGDLVEVKSGLSVGDHVIISEKTARGG